MVIFKKIIITAFYSGHTVSREGRSAYKVTEVAGWRCSSDPAQPVCVCVCVCVCVYVCVYT